MQSLSIHCNIQVKTKAAFLKILLYNTIVYKYQWVFVQSKLAIFDGPPASIAAAAALSGNAKKIAERRLTILATANATKLKPKIDEI
jgi:hypothetical protein